MDDQTQVASTKPYFIRAIYEWCTDNGFTPYLAVKVDHNVQVPLEFVNDGEIVLNIRFDATSGLDLANDYIRFQARFAGAVRDIIVPVDHVMAIYARENGQGMAFPVSVPDNGVQSGEKTTSPIRAPQAGKPAVSGPALHLVGADDKDKSSESDSRPEDHEPEPPEPTPPENGGKNKKPTLRLVK